MEEEEDEDKEEPPDSRDMVSAPFPPATPPYLCAVTCLPKTGTIWNQADFHKDRDSFKHALVLVMSMLSVFLSSMLVLELCC